MIIDNELQRLSSESKQFSFSKSRSKSPNKWSPNKNQKVQHQKNCNSKNFGKDCRSDAGNKSKFHKYKRVIFYPESNLEEQSFASGHHSWKIPNPTNDSNLQNFEMERQSPLMDGFTISHFNKYEPEKRDKMEDFNMHFARRKNNTLVKPKENTHILKKIFTKDQRKRTTSDLVSNKKI
mmetsp:Transcript_1936/g.1740  ORF Transcript_1936/g.1740 Transcript_1936/m.1740 type:complete len:179 (+) Transcript_1936:733-1269(+)